MSRIPKTVPQETIHAEWWADSEHVTIKTYAGSYDRDRIRAAALLQHPGNTTEFRPQESNLCKLEVFVVGWTFTYDDGTPIVLNRESLGQLDERDRNYILSQIDEALASWDTTRGGSSDKRATFQLPDVPDPGRPE